MNKPYVYKRAEDLGLKISDGKTAKYVAVTKDDVVRAKKADSQHCALARSALRLPGVRAAYFFRQTAFLEYADRMEKYELPVSVQKEIVSFDRAQIFAEGAYQLSPPRPSNRRQALKRRVTDRKKQKLATKAVLDATIAKIISADPPNDTPEQREFNAKVTMVIKKNLGKRTVSGIRAPNAPDPLPSTAPSRYVHRTQYIRDLREPSSKK